MIPTLTKPADMVDLPRHLLGHMERFALDWAGSRRHSLVNPRGQTIGPEDIAHAGWKHLVYATEDVCRLAEAAAQTLPHEPLDQGIMPFGGERTLLYLASPFGGVGRAVGWFNGGYQSSRNPDGTIAPVGVMLLGFSDENTVTCQWNYNTPPEDYLGRLIADMKPEHQMTADWFVKFVLSLWLLASQPGIIAETDALMDRAARRRTSRSNAPPVRVIDLRHSQHHSNNTEPAYHLSRRFIVRGHWRQQAYGTGRALRRPTWIAPHIKGPDDAPLDMRPTVYRLSE
jgi:hypothetical protein